MNDCKFENEFGRCFFGAGHSIKYHAVKVSETVTPKRTANGARVNVVKTDMRRFDLIGREIPKGEEDSLKYHY
ncbi:hypothetical protein [Tomitella gaofuii]|uniref:hypothetical protein n=1 Tax=Tomitella gaofuii TaxID=2760083 RepID=UPI0015FCA623|nr:hypothetical protein [Tomitella gaofuii]